jgi:hypothetical protein
LQFELPVLQGLYKSFNDRKALCQIGFVSGAKLKISVLLEFLRTLTERLAQAFTKLQLSFALCCITIRKTFLSEVIDCSQNFLKPVDSVRELFDESGF